MSSSSGFHKEINITHCNFFYLCVVTLSIMWLNCKIKTKNNSKKNNQKTHEKKDRQKYLTENLPVMKAKVSHSDLGASMPEWGGRNPYSGVTSWYWRREKCDLWLRWHHRAAWCKWCKAASAEDSASALQMLYLPCFRISVAWSCAPTSNWSKKDQLWEHIFWFCYIQKESGLHIVTAQWVVMVQEWPEAQGQHRWMTVCGCDLHLWEQDNKTQSELHGSLVW